MKPEDFDPDDYSQEYFHDLIQQFDGHSDWVFSSNNVSTQGNIAQEASEFRQMEAEFDHVETDATLYLTVPHAFEPVKAATGSIEQPLDGNQETDPYEDSFGEEIQEAYESVVDGYEADYLDTEEVNPRRIMGVSVPLDWDGDVLEESLDVASEASRETQQLNDDVVNVLREYQ
ncbi:hypothetical protein [Halorhabdus salina]|uniref:hypothetical protein n=1 Tax=Halorhabdus salina TaxID=2750670 RepID=UPI0015EF33C8|nr:hypothetical protein [Halorhabdus salina]